MALRQDLSAWCETVADNLPTLRHAEKRDAWVALGVEVRARRMDHPPTLGSDDAIGRYSVTFSQAKAPLRQTSAQALPPLDFSAPRSKA